MGGRGVCHDSRQHLARKNRTTDRWTSRASPVHACPHHKHPNTPIQAPGAAALPISHPAFLLIARLALFVSYAALPVHTLSHCFFFSPPPHLLPPPSSLPYHIPRGEHEQRQGLVWTSAEQQIAQTCTEQSGHRVNRPGGVGLIFMQRAKSITAALSRASRRTTRRLTCYCSFCMCVCVCFLLLVCFVLFFG